MCLGDFTSSYVTKKHNQSYKDRYKEDEGDILCNVKKQTYLDIDYEELQNFSFVQSVEEEDNAEFSMINPNLLDLDLEDSDSVSNAPAVSTIIDTRYHFLMNSFLKYTLN